MELKQYQIHENRTKAKAENQIHMSEDFSLPEGKPDVAEILQKKSEIIVEEVCPEKGKIKIRGMLKLWVLYLAQRSEERLGSLEMELPFEELLYIEGVSNGDHLKIGWSIEDVKVTIIHPGKLGVTAVVTLSGSVNTEEGVFLTEDVEARENIFTKTETFPMAESVIEKKENYHIKDEVVLPVNKPNVQKVLWKDLQLRAMELRMQEGRIGVKGEVLFFVVYQGEEESDGIQWLEQSIPFHGTLEVPEITSEMFGMLGTEIVQQTIELQTDYDGELRVFRLEMVLELQLQIFRERSCKRLTDAYSTKERLLLQKQDVSLKRLRMCNYAKCRVSGQGKVQEDTKIMQILGHRAKIQNRHTKITEQGILWEGNLEIQVLYLTVDERKPLGCVVVTIPCRHLIEVPGINGNDVWQIDEMLEQILINLPDRGQIEVRGVVNLNVCVLEQFQVNQVSEILPEAYDLEEYKKRPGIKIHFVQKGEDLWSIAKENQVSMEEIKKRNGLAADEIVAGQKLLLIKPRMDTVLF